MYVYEKPQDLDTSYNICPGRKGRKAKIKGEQREIEAKVSWISLTQSSPSILKQEAFDVVQNLGCVCVCVLKTWHGNSTICVFWTQFKLSTHAYAMFLYIYTCVCEVKSLKNEIMLMSFNYAVFLSK